MKKLFILFFLSIILISCWKVMDENNDLVSQESENNPIQESSNVSSDTIVENNAVWSWITDETRPILPWPRWLAR